MEKYCTVEQVINDSWRMSIAAGYLRLQTRTQNIQYILLFHCSRGSTNVPKYNVYTYNACLVLLLLSIPFVVYNIMSNVCSTRVKITAVPLFML